MTEVNEKLSQDILSEITIFNKYAKYLPEESRRETWVEIVDRNIEMHLKKFPDLELDIKWAYQFVLDKKILPSMRSMQFAGKAADVNPARLYNCSFMTVNNYKAFQEAMFLLLSGCGVGYSVQKHHVEQLPPVRKPNNKRRRRYVVGDSITGWADAIKMLMKSYFGMYSSVIDFDYSDIRQKGSLLVTSGGKAPGPQPLKEAIVKIQGILDSKNDGDKLSTLEVHDIFCHIADAVLSGGIRRAAMISLFSIDDNEMLSSKAGNWWELNPQRGRANNSVVVVRTRATKGDFYNLWGYMQASGSGEPGISWTNNPEYGYNPCHEISLRNMQMCNLTEINVSDIESQKDFNDRARAASIIGTLQASYTDFHYLREEWKSNCDRDALLGVSMTGIASMNIFDYNIEEGAKVVVDTNAIFAEKININKAARSTTVKPAGTTSLVFGTCSGIHAWHDKYYKRRIRVNKNESLYAYLSIYHPNLIEDDFFKPKDTAIISIPQKAPKGAVLRTESPLDLLNRVNNIYNKWIKPGFKSGYNNHNVSCTVSIKDNEWDAVRDWMWVNRDNYSGISIIPFSNHSYIQAPFESCTKEDYEELLKSLTTIDLSKVIEIEDQTGAKDTIACSGGSCEI